MVVAVAATVASAYLGRGYFVDVWWMWKLRSTDREVRMGAAQRLAERKCLRAVTAIMALIHEDDEECVSLHQGAGETWRAASPLVLALWQMGEEAIPTIARAFDSLRDSTTAAKAARLDGVVQDLRDRSAPMIRQRLRKEGGGGPARRARL